MTTPITSTTSLQPSAQSTPGTTRLRSQLDTPTLFIKLFMAELQHQDPTNPATPASIAQQTAELSQMEASMSLTNAIKSQSRDAEDSAATGLLGKQVTAMLTGNQVTGTVSEISLSSTGTPVLKVGEAMVPLSAVTAVTTAAGAQTTTP
jgi:flagellar basal-body rod modification protein FlgD